MLVRVFDYGTGPSFTTVFALYICLVFISLFVCFIFLRLLLHLYLGISLLMFEQEWKVENLNTKSFKLLQQMPCVCVCCAWTYGVLCDTIHSSPSRKQ